MSQNPSQGPLGVKNQVAKGGPSNDTNVLQPQGDLGYLSIQVFFHEEPVEHLKIEFKKFDHSALAVPSVPHVFTDKDGKASIDTLVATGNYAVIIDDPQHWKSISTVEDPNKPYIIALPVGRPLFDIGGNWEFTRA